MQNFFFKKCLFENENQFPFRKNKKKHFWGQFQKYFVAAIFVVAIKKMLVIHFPYMEIVWLAFF